MNISLVKIYRALNKVLDSDSLIDAMNMVIDYYNPLEPHLMGDYFNEEYLYIKMKFKIYSPSYSIKYHIILCEKFELYKKMTDL